MGFPVEGSQKGADKVGGFLFMQQRLITFPKCFFVVFRGPESSPGQAVYSVGCVLPVTIHPGPTLHPKAPPRKSVFSRLLLLAAILCYS